MGGTLRNPDRKSPCLPAFGRHRKDILVLAKRLEGCCRFV